MILVTGGAGYIGSKVVYDMIKENYKIAVIDNLSSGHQKALPDEAYFFTADLLDEKAVKEVFNEVKPKAVMHFAAKSIVQESLINPLDTFNTNLKGTLNLLQAMRDCGTKYLVFSSTAAIYGEPQEIPITEDHPLQPTNPYGESKLFIETILSRLAESEQISFISLRYFNAAGADISANLGEDHRPETHLIPIILSVAAGKKNNLMVYGKDYPTHDGTPVRDYIHIEDLSLAHILALRALIDGKVKQDNYNLGFERGYSVLEVIKCAEKITNQPIPYSFGPRREGDPSTLIASSYKIKNALGWHPTHSDLENIMESAWNWHRENPNGYKY